MKQIIQIFFFIFFISATACHGFDTANTNSSDTGKLMKLSPVKADVTLTLPEHFSATLFAGGLGKARHISITPTGYVYVKLDYLKKGNTIVRLKDTNGDGVADEELISVVLKERVYV
jgi:hypothetical protein